MHINALAVEDVVNRYNIRTAFIDTAEPSNSTRCQYFSRFISSQMPDHTAHLLTRDRSALHPSRIASPTPDNLNRALRVRRNGLRHRSKPQLSQPAVAVRAHHNQIRLPSFSLAEDLVLRGTPDNVGGHAQVVALPGVYSIRSFVMMARP